MELKGIKVGDKEFKHFTFDDEPVVRGGKYYYKVNYGKDPLEGEYGEDRIDYIECKDVRALGGRKPKPIPGLNPVPEVEDVMVEAPKPTRGRPVKAKAVSAEGGNYPVAVGSGKYEYDIVIIKSNDPNVIKEKLNVKGAKGWEMCGFDTNKSLIGDTQIIAIFKRML